jgi:hypothetical protein
MTLTIRKISEEDKKKMAYLEEKLQTKSSAKVLLICMNKVYEMLK